jgi:hypothetical protein
VPTFTQDQVKRVLLGNGDFRLGSPLIHAGPIKGNAIIDITRTIQRFKAGLPLLTVKQLATDEELFFKGTYASFDLNIMQEALGMGTFASVAAGNTPVTAGVTFNDPDIATMAGSTTGAPGGLGFVGVMLGYQDIQASPAPVVQDAVTLVNYPASAYTIDSTYGMITRTTGSSIPALAAVNVFLTYAAQAAESYAFGGLVGVGYVPGQFIHTRADGKRVILHMWRLSTNGRFMFEFRETEYNLFDVQFNLLADVARPVGSQYFKIIREI